MEALVKPLGLFYESRYPVKQNTIVDALAGDCDGTLVWLLGKDRALSRLRAGFGTGECTLGSSHTAPQRESCDSARTDPRCPGKTKCSSAHPSHYSRPRLQGGFNRRSGPSGGERLQPSAWVWSRRRRTSRQPPRKRYHMQINPFQPPFLAPARTVPGLGMYGRGLNWSRAETGGPAFHTPVDGPLDDSSPLGARPTATALGHGFPLPRQEL